MINNKLENTIMSLIPSKTLKNAINATKHKFSDIELVQLIIEFAPSWERMILLLFETKKYIEDKKIKKFITQYINKEKKQYDMLVTEQEGYVYDVIMDPRNHMDSYLVPNFASAKKTIDSFLKAYKDFIFFKNQYSKIEIVKRKVAIRDSSRDIDKNDEPVRCELNSKRQIYRIYSDLKEVDIEKIGIELNGVKYPDAFNVGDLLYVDLNKYPFLEPYDYDNYYSNIDGGMMYGINSCDHKSDIAEESTCCFLELSSELVEYRKIEIAEDGYCRYLMWHHHIDFGYLEKADLNNIPNKIREDYEYTINALIKLNCIKC